MYHFRGRFESTQESISEGEDDSGVTEDPTKINNNNVDDLDNFNDDDNEIECDDDDIECDNDFVNSTVNSNISYNGDITLKSDDGATVDLENAKNGRVSDKVVGDREKGGTENITSSDEEAGRGMKSTHR